MFRVSIKIHGKMICFRTFNISDRTLENCQRIDILILDKCGASGSSELECKRFVCAKLFCIVVMENLLFPPSNYSVDRLFSDEERQQDKMF